MIVSTRLVSIREDGNNYNSQRGRVVVSIFRSLPKWIAETSFNGDGICFEGGYVSRWVNIVAATPGEAFEKAKFITIKRSEEN